MSPLDFQNACDSHKLGSYSVEQRDVLLVFSVQKCPLKITLLSDNDLKFNYLNCSLAR